MQPDMVFFGYQFSLATAMSWIIFTFILSIIIYLWRIQASGKLDFADMFTKDGKSVSLTKVLQFIGGITATWAMIKLTLSGVLSPELFGVYLAYVGGVEGYSKFVSAKYNYQERSIRDGGQPSAQPPVYEQPMGEQPMGEQSCCHQSPKGPCKDMQGGVSA